MSVPLSLQLAGEAAEASKAVASMKGDASLDVWVMFHQGSVV